MYRKLFKRVLDVIIAVALLFVLLPLIFTIAIVNYFSNQGNILFVQERIGLDCRRFQLFKFTTMTSKPGLGGKVVYDGLLKREVYVSAWHNFLRKTGMDELPQLLNVIGNDLSLIGPRPLMPEYLNYYNKEQLKRHQIKPGITGLAQVNGRNQLNWDQRLALDVQYVKEISLYLDVKIIFKTILQLFKSEEDIVGKSFIEYKESLN